MGTTARNALNAIAARGVRFVRPVAVIGAQGLLAAAYRQMRRDFVVAAPFTLHSPDPELTAAVWSVVRESLIAGPADRAARELIGTAVSEANRCPYCADAHLMMLSAAGGAANPAVGAWARAVGAPGHTPPVRPFAPEDAPQMIGTAVAFHYINRMVTIFVAGSPWPPLTPKAVKRLGGRILASDVASAAAAPGESLALLPDSPLPPDLAWAAANRFVGGAFARLAAAAEAAGVAALSKPARVVVVARLRAWRGEPPPLDGAWSEEALADVDAADRAMARLALLAAFAPHRVDRQLIAACRAGGADDRAMVGAASWASFAAARRLGKAIAAPERDVAWQPGRDSNP